MKLFPNPANKAITIDALLINKGNYSIKMFDDQGKAVLTIPNILTDNNGRIIKTLDISSFNHGYYTCGIKSDKISVSKPFIIIE